MTDQTQIPDHTVISEVTVNLATGEAFISQTKAAAELGIARSSLQKWLVREQVEYDVKQGLSSEILALAAAYYALDSVVATTEAKELLRKISQAGAKAYLYHEAGLSIGVTQQRPLTQLEAYEELVRMEKTRLALLDTVGAQQKRLGTQQKVIDHKNIKTDCSDTHFTIKRVRALNQGMKIDPKILLKVSQHLEAEVESVYGHYKQTINQYSRDVWEEAYPDAILPE